MGKQEVTFNLKKCQMPHGRVSGSVLTDNTNQLQRPIATTKQQIKLAVTFTFHSLRLYAAKAQCFFWTMSQRSHSGYHCDQVQVQLRARFYVNVKLSQYTHLLNNRTMSSNPSRQPSKNISTDQWSVWLLLCLSLCSETHITSTL